MMEKFNRLSSHLIPLMEKDVDTDQIIPARFLKTTGKDGLGDHLFADWRYLQSGAPNPEFVFNQPQVQGAKILLAGSNFGCGSSREHAAWALLGWGVRAVISTSFADIFHANALKNGLLPIEVDEATHTDLHALVQHEPQAELTIDLASQRIRFGEGRAADFSIDPFAKRSLMDGIDQLEYLLSLEEEIGTFEVAHEKS